MFLNSDTTGHDTIHENITVTIVNAPLYSLRSYFAVSKRNLKRKMLDPEFLSEGERKVGKYDSKWLIMTHRFGGATYQVKIYYFLKGGVAYLFILTSIPEEFASHEALGDRIMETLVLAR